MMEELKESYQRAVEKDNPGLERHLKEMKTKRAEKLAENVELGDRIFNYVLKGVFYTGLSAGVFLGVYYGVKELIK